MKTLRTILLVSFAAFMFANTGCKKYEEGPTISLRSKKARVVNEWKVVKIFENGKEQDMDDMKLWYDFNDDWTGRTYISFTINGQEYSGENNFDWEFNDDKTKILIKTKDANGNTQTDEAVILKLYEKEMWLKETDDNGDEWEYHFEPR